MLVVQTQKLDPWRNLALEELCLDRAGRDGRILFLWQSSDAVIIGKNQNPWLECSLPDMEKDGVKLARRLSGGGAVFHDAGNLNFAFVVPRREYKDGTIFDIVIAALKRCGVEAVRMGKNSLGVHGRKISGNAFCYRRDSVLHHGTLLVAADVEKMKRCLSCRHRGIHSKAIRSNPALVVNLRDVSDAITVPRLAAAIAEAAADHGRQEIAWGGEELFDSPCLEQIEKKYASWEWRFGMTPPFDVEMTSRFSWGEARVGFRVEKAVVRQSTVELQGDYQPISSVISQGLPGVRFSEADLVDCLGKQTPAFKKADAVEFARWLVGS